MVLTKDERDYEAFLESAVKNVVVAVPAYFDDSPLSLGLETA